MIVHQAEQMERLRAAYRRYSGAPVPCTCALVVAVWHELGAPADRRPAYDGLGWHYDLCARTVAALQGAPQ